MKKTLSLLLLFTAFLVNAQEKKNTQKIKFVEVSCGQCKFGMKSGGCDLAVRIDGKSYFVDGAKIDQYGDSHAKDGFCEVDRKSVV